MKTTIKEAKMLKSLKSLLSEVECDIVFNHEKAKFSINLDNGCDIEDILLICEKWISGKCRVIGDDLIEEYTIEYYTEGVFYG